MTNRQIKNLKSSRISPFLALKKILRFARVLRLAPGDQLPPQSTLRKTLGLTNFVIDDAMGKLKDWGVISRTRSKGTILENPEKIPPHIFNLAVLSLSPGENSISPFALNVFNYLVIEILKAGFDCKPYVAQIAHKDFSSFRLKDFFGLRDGIESGSVDAILTPIMFRFKDDPVFAEGGFPVIEMSHNAPICGVVIDTATMVENALFELHRQGCKRFGIVNMDGPKPEHNLFWEGFERGLKKLGLPIDSGILLTTDLLEAEQGGLLAAKKYGALSVLERPDALVVMDDRIALALHAVLMQNALPIPKIAYLFNIQAPVHFDSQTIKYGLDIQKFAEAGVRLARARLLKPHLPPASVFFPVPLLHSNAVSYTSG